MSRQHRRLILAIALAAVAVSHSALAQDGEEQTLKVLELKYRIELEKSRAPVVGLGDRYLEALASLQETFQQAGDLDSVIVVNTEIERFASSREVPRAVSEIAELAKVQKILLDQQEKVELAADRQLHTTKLAYRRALSAAVKELTSKGEVDEALAAREEIAKLGILSDKLETWGRGMVLHLGFNFTGEGGRLSDASGEENHGILKGDAKLVTPEKGARRGRYLSLDGRGDFAQCAHHETLVLDKSATISLWLRPRELRSMRGLVCKYISSNSYTLRVWGNGKGARISFGDYSFSNRSRLSPPIGKWTHVVVTLDGGRMKFYFDGRLDREGSSRKERGLTKNTSPVRIGSDYDGRYFNGDIDEVRIYRRALSAGEIANLYQAERDR